MFFAPAPRGPFACSPLLCRGLECLGPCCACCLLAAAGGAAAGARPRPRWRGRDGEQGPALARVALARGPPLPYPAPCLTNKCCPAFWLERPSNTITIATTTSAVDDDVGQHVSYCGCLLFWPPPPSPFGGCSSSRGRPRRKATRQPLGRAAFGSLPRWRE